MATKDADSSADGARAVVGTRSVDIVLSLALLGLAALLGWDSWRIGMSWAADGPQAGYFPFYLSIIMGAASAYGLVAALTARAMRTADAFVTREQFGRVLKVLVPTHRLLRR